MSACWLTGVAAGSKCCRRLLTSPSAFEAHKPAAPCWGPPVDRSAGAPADLRKTKGPSQAEARGAQKGHSKLLGSLDFPTAGQATPSTRPRGSTLPSAASKPLIGFQTCFNPGADLAQLSGIRLPLRIVSSSLKPSCSVDCAVQFEPLRLVGSEPDEHLVNPSLSGSGSHPYFPFQAHTLTCWIAIVTVILYFPLQARQYDVSHVPWDPIQRAGPRHSEPQMCQTQNLEIGRAPIDFRSFWVAFA